MWIPVSFLFFLLNLLGWHWLIQSYSFQVYNSIVQHMYTALCAHRPLPSYTPPPSFPAGPHHTVVCVWVVCFFACWLHPLTFSTQPSTALPSDSCQSVSILFVSLFCALVSTSEIIWYLSLSNWLISLSVMLFHSVAEGKISFFTAE